MATIFSHGTRELITDAAINALDNARGEGLPDAAAREEFLKAAGLAFDVAAEDLEDADPEGQRQEFLG